MQKQLEEERFHAGHGAAWLRRLSTASHEARASLQDALEARWSPILHWFGPDEFGEQGKTEGLWDAEGGELRLRFLERTKRLLARATLKVPAVRLDFSDWDVRRRRSAHGGPDAEAVTRARGDRNRAFLMD